MYIHGVGTIGALVEVSSVSDEAAEREAFIELCHDLAMQVAASNPISVRPEDLSSEIMEKEKEIFEAQARESGKPEKIVPKIVEGKLKKYYTEACLLEQAFVKDPGKSVKKLLDEKSKELGGHITVKRFSRFQLGE